MDRRQQYYYALNQNMVEFTAYRDRVLAAGGNLTDIEFSKSEVKMLKQQGLLDKASLIMIPGAGKSGTLFNLKPNNADFTFSRNSVKWVLGKSGLLEQVAANVPAYEYDAATGRYNLLIEQQRTNYITRSQEINLWSSSNASVSQNVAIAPDGSLTADLLYPSSSGDFRRIWASDADRTTVSAFSFFAKVSGKRYINVCNPDTIISSVGITFDLQNKVVAYTLAGSNLIGYIQDFGNGWCRCVVVLSVAVGTNRAYLFPSDTVNSISVTANGQDGVLIWGAQMEAGAYQSSYIQTSGSTVTRLVDHTIISGLQSKGLITPNNFTFFVDINVIARDNAGSNTQLIFETSSSEDVFGIQFNKLNPSQKSGYYFTAAQVIGSFTPGDKVAVSYGGGICKVFVAGILIGQASINLSTIDVLHTNSTSWYSNALVRQIAFFTTTLTDSECITLTT